MNKTLRGQSGFGLIEVLIAAVVVAIGLLSVASLHSRLVAQSSDSKARAEATALAQARIEDLRNYTNQITSRTEFDTEFAATADFVNSTTLNGVNATFTRSEAVGNVGAAKEIQVRVGWTDAAGVPRDVMMATRVVWESPKTVGDIARISSEPLLSGPTGRARIGEGLVPADAQLSVEDVDGTQIWDDGSGDLKLVVDGRVVLTLLQACQVDEIDGNDCLNFVKINGRVYIDTAEQNNLDPGEVHVIASDASYCQRYYTDADGNPVVVNDDTTSARTTDDGDYEWFDYRCYVGGGWYGNIGILLSDGIKQNDKVCLGDPTASDETWKAPRIAARRAYRGMLRRADNTTDSGYVESALGDPVYFTVGVGDGVEFPDPSYADWEWGGSYDEGTIVVYDDYEYRALLDIEESTINPYYSAGWLWSAIGAHGGHDFVISSLSTSLTAGTNCITQGVMVRDDAEVDGEPGAIFAGVPNDFVCLNPDHTDLFPEDYEAPIQCPYPPTNGPALKHTLSGVITVDQNEIELAELITVQTSDGAGTCTREPFSGSGILSATYSCDIYEWGDGWNGFVTIKPNSYELLCTDGGADSTLNDQQPLSGVTDDTSGRDFTCNVGGWSLIAGTVTTSDLTNTLSGAQIASSIGSSEGWCTIDLDGLGFACTTGTFESAWSGTITLSTTDGVLCGTVDGTVSVSNIEAGLYELGLVIARRSSDCP